MNTHVIILAQGNQSRLGDYAHVPKCLLRLPACNSTTILHRTLTQLWMLMDGIGNQGSNHHRVTVVSWYEVKKVLDAHPVRAGDWRPQALLTFRPSFDSLVDPGNSSLKGIARYLDVAARSGHPLHNESWPDRIVVLLGDVVYSWRCLDAMLSPSGESNIVFTGTSDLGPGGGELWGIRWDRSADLLMRRRLESALAKHPKFDAYQPGQLRNWLWEIDKSLPWAAATRANRDWFIPIDDYTKDIDVPSDVELLSPLSERAAIDDKEHGVTW